MKEPKKLSCVRVSLALVLGILSLSGMLPLMGVDIGDAESSMLEELGAPLGKMKSGDVLIYTFSTGAVHVQEGKVVELSGSFRKKQADTIIRIGVEKPDPIPDTSEGPASGMALSDELLARRDQVRFQWKTHWGVVKELSEAENKPILILFTASETDEPSRKMEREVFRTEPFLKFAEAQLVLMQVETIANPLAQPRWIREQTESLIRNYNIQSYPSVVLVSVKGEILGRTGSNKEGVEAYLLNLKQMLGLVPREEVPEGGTVTKNRDVAEKPSFMEKVLSFMQSPAFMINAGGVIILVIVILWSRRN